MAKRRVFLSLAFGFISLNSVGGDAPSVQPVNTNGAYQTYLAGYYSGPGSVTVGGGTVAISATVSSSAGSGAFSAPGLQLVGNHFAGAGTALGASVMVVGRIDGYSHDTYFRGARILGFYTDGNGHGGRIGGFLQGAGSGGTSTGSGGTSTGSGSGSTTGSGGTSSSGSGSSGGPPVAIPESTPP